MIISLLKDDKLGKSISGLLIACATLVTANLHATSLVYNLRIAETSRQRIFKENAVKNKHNFISSVILVEQFRKQYNGIHNNLSGGIATLIYVKDSYYFRADFAAAQVRVPQTHFSQVQTDDLLLSAGYRHQLNQITKLTVSALLGIPTHKDTNLQHYSMGTGHVGIGLQIDGSVLYSQNHKHSIISAIRFIHFAKRNAALTLARQTRCFELDLGNLADLFIAHYSNWGRHGFEFGYNPSFGFATSIKPRLDAAVHAASFMSSSFYSFYSCGFLIKDMRSAVVFGMSGGFSHTPKDVGYRYGVTTWAGFRINF